MARTRTPPSFLRSLPSAGRYRISGPSGSAASHSTSSVQARLARGAREWVRPQLYEDTTSVVPAASSSAAASSAAAAASVVLSSASARSNAACARCAAALLPPALPAPLPLNPLLPLPVPFADAGGARGGATAGRPTGEHGAASASAAAKGEGAKARSKPSSHRAPGSGSTVYAASGCGAVSPPPAASSALSLVQMAR